MKSKFKTVRIHNDVWEHLEFLASIRGQTIPEVLNDAFGHITPEMLLQTPMLLQESAMRSGRVYDELMC